MLGGSGRGEDSRNVPKNMQDTSEHIDERLEPGSQQNSPSSARFDPDEPGNETATPGGVYSDPECPRSKRNGCGSAMNVQGRDTSK